MGHRKGKYPYKRWCRTCEKYFPTKHRITSKCPRCKKETRIKLLIKKRKEEQGRNSIFKG